MQLSFEPGEEVVRAGGARAVANGGSAGVLCLTTKRLVYARETTKGVVEQSTPLSIISKATTYRALGLVPLGVEVVLTDGTRERFIIAAGGRWAALVEAARRGEVTTRMEGLGTDAAPGPLEPVVSWPAVALWIVAPLCFLPLLGAVPTLAALAFSLMLLVRSQRRRHDAAMGKVGLGLSVVALLFSAMSWIGVTSLFHPAVVPEETTNDDSLLMSGAQILVLFISVVLHECGHALAAYFGGDSLAKRRGRLTLNPLKHVDLVGSILLPGMLMLANTGFLFGWAKPVPINLAALRRQRLGNFAVSVAGVSANLLVALFCLGALVSLGVGVKLLFPEAAAAGFWLPSHHPSLTGAPGGSAIVIAAALLKYGVFINILLLVFNLLPIPPLDGSHVLELLLPRALAPLWAKVRRAGFFIVILVMVTGMLTPVFRVADFVVVHLCYFAGHLTGLG